MAGEIRIPVKKEVYLLVKYYSLNSGLSMSKVTQILYSSNANVYNKEQAMLLLEKYKRTRRG